MKQTTLGQQGNALILVLILLTMLSILAVSAMDTGTVEQKMAGNIQFQSKTFNDAEAALAFGEKYIENDMSGTFETFKASSPVGITIVDGSFTVPGTSTGSTVTVTHISSQVVVEIQEPYTGSDPGCGNGETGCVDYFRVTATSSGSGSASQTVESIFGHYTEYAG